MIKLLLLDIDDTICNSTAAYAKTLPHCYKVFQTYYPTVSKVRFLKTYAQARDRVHKRLAGTAAMHNRALYFEAMVEELKLPYIPAALVKLTSTYWQNSYRYLRLYAGVKPVLQFIKEQGIRIAVVSDLLEQVQEEKLRHLQLNRYFDFLLTSEAIGHEKPRPEIFLTALKRAKCKPGQTIMVGDSYQRDVRGAKRLGIMTVLVGSTKKHSADFQVRHFRELKSVITKVQKMH